MKELSVNNVGMIYEVPNSEDVTALHDVSFGLEAGRLLTLLGPSGCGKTTLLNILAGFLAPTSGKVTLEGDVITGPGGDRGMVFQQGALFEWLTVSDNISFGKRLDDDQQLGPGKWILLVLGALQLISIVVGGFLRGPILGVALLVIFGGLVASAARERAVLHSLLVGAGLLFCAVTALVVFQLVWDTNKWAGIVVALVLVALPFVAVRLRKQRARLRHRDRVDDLLDTVGLAGFGDKMVYELSGGMQQRVALARCLANDPDVILMDEPLGALDALTREKMQKLILELWEETGKTIILVTHSVDEALYLGDRLFVMAPRPGRIERDYDLPFARQALTADARKLKNSPEFIEKREEILSLIWEMEEQIMGGS